MTDEDVNLDTELNAEAIENDVFEGEDNSDDMSKAISQLIEQLGEEENIQMFSHLSDREIKHIAVIKSMDDKTMDEFVQHFLKLKVSKQRKGRNELLDVSSAISKLHELDKTGGLLDKIKR